MDTKKYEVFEKTVELGSLTRAGEELGLTQSGVSHIISALEDELGVPLLRRTRTGARLTDAGAKLMPSIRQILRAEERLRWTAESSRIQPAKPMPPGRICLSRARRASRAGLPVTQLIWRNCALKR